MTLVLIMTVCSGEYGAICTHRLRRTVLVVRGDRRRIRVHTVPRRQPWMRAVAPRRAIPIPSLNLAARASSQTDPNTNNTTTRNISLRTAYPWVLGRRLTNVGRAASAVSAATAQQPDPPSLATGQQPLQPGPTAHRLQTGAANPGDWCKASVN